VRPWAPPTDVTATNPGAPTEKDGGPVETQDRSVQPIRADSDGNIVESLRLTPCPVSICQLTVPSTAVTNCGCDGWS
jgi:hypothetical protein